MRHLHWSVIILAALTILACSGTRIKVTTCLYDGPIPHGITQAEADRIYESFAATDAALTMVEIAYTVTTEHEGDPPTWPYLELISGEYNGTSSETMVLINTSGDPTLIESARVINAEDLSRVDRSEPPSGLSSRRYAIVPPQSGTRIPVPERMPITEHADIDLQRYVAQWRILYPHFLEIYAEERSTAEHAPHAHGSMVGDFVNDELVEAILELESLASGLAQGLRKYLGAGSEDTAADNTVCENFSRCFEEFTNAWIHLREGANAEFASRDLVVDAGNALASALIQQTQRLEEEAESPAIPTSFRITAANYINSATATSRLIEQNRQIQDHGDPRWRYILENAHPWDWEIYMHDEITTDGETELAIAQLGIDRFKLKSLSNDPTETVRAYAAVTERTLQIAAGLMAAQGGVVQAVPRSENGQYIWPSDPQADMSGRVTTARRDEQLANERYQRLRTLLRQAGNILQTNSGTHVPTDAERDQALELIRTAQSIIGTFPKSDEVAVSALMEQVQTATANVESSAATVTRAVASAESSASTAILAAVTAAGHRSDANRAAALAFQSELNAAQAASRELQAVLMQPMTVSGELVGTISNVTTGNPASSFEVTTGRLRLSP